jgi:TIR domain
MSVPPVPSVFLSYSHIDKRVARRLVRRLTAHAVKAWLDERELRIGAALPASIRAQIQDADILLVVASEASAVSKWVGMELEFAEEHGKPVVPFFIEPLATHERFRDYLGVDATSPQGFADAIHGLMNDLYRSFDRELPPPSRTVLETSLRELAREEPDLAPLIIGCLDSKGLHQESMAAYKASCHPLDEALNALFDLMPNDVVAYHAAYGFCLAGAGVRALSLWIAATGDGGTPLVTAVGSRRLEPALIETAITLLGACAPPNNHALYQFINYNAEQLDQEQRSSVLRLVTWPIREDTARLADVLGWVALEHFPDAVEVRQMWSRWIQRGAFDGKPGTPTNLARYLADAHTKGLPGWEPVHEVLRSHVREYLRSGDKNKVIIAMDHVQAAADVGAPVLTLLLREAEGVSGTAEWEDWEKKDRDTAKRMKWYVFMMVREATGDRDWLRALKEAEKMVAFEEEPQQILAKDEQGPEWDK